MNDTQNAGALWNERYDREDYLYGEEPNAFIRATVPPAKPGATAFAPADGEGRNGVWLARLGYAVTSVDVSDKAVAKARALAARHGVTVDAAVGDLFAPLAGDPLFDLVIVSFMHFGPRQRQRFHRLLQDRLKRGGLLVYEAFHKDQLKTGSGGPKDENMLITRDIVGCEFAGMDIILLQEARRYQHGTRHDGESALVQLVAKKRG